jgi:hypothetical protein
MPSSLRHSRVERRHATPYQQLPEADGVWIFVSHSNLDLTKARQIRDALEKDGHNPLLFLLKGLQKNDERLPQLIRDEIKARTWFVLCESAHSKASPWVQEEVGIVKSTKSLTQKALAVHHRL